MGDVIKSEADEAIEVLCAEIARAKAACLGAALRAAKGDKGMDALAFVQAIEVLDRILHRNCGAMPAWPVGGVVMTPA